MSLGESVQTNPPQSDSKPSFGGMKTEADRVVVSSSALSAEIAKLQLEITSMGELSTRNSKSVDEMKSVMDSLFEANERLLAERELACQRIQTANEEIEALDGKIGELGALQEQHIGLIAQKESELAEASKKLEELLALLPQDGTSPSKDGTPSAPLPEILARFNQILHRVFALVLERNALQRNLEGVRGEREKLEAELSRVREELRKRTTEAKKTQDELKQITDAIVKGSTALAESLCTGTIGMLKTQITAEGITTFMGTATTTVEKLNEQLKEMEERDKRLTAELEAFKGEKTKTDKRLAESEIKFETSERGKEELKKQLEQSKRENEKLKKQLAKKPKEDELQRRLEATSEECMRKDKRIADLAGQLGELTHESRIQYTVGYSDCAAKRGQLYKPLSAHANLLQTLEDAKASLQESLKCVQERINFEQKRKAKKP